jgi:hypothetical protein
MNIPVRLSMAMPLNDTAMSSELLIAPVDVAADAAGSDAGLPKLILPHADVRGATYGVDAIARAIIPDAVATADMPDRVSVIFADARAPADDIPTRPTRAGASENASVPHAVASDIPETATDSESAKTPVAVIDDDPAVVTEAFNVTDPDDTAADTPVIPNVRDIVPVDAVASDPASAVT